MITVMIYGAHNICIQVFVIFFVLIGCLLRNIFVVSLKSFGGDVNHFIRLSNTFSIANTFVATIRCCFAGFYKIRKLWESHVTD